MELKKQDVGVWVKASEEPEKSSVYHVKINSFDCKAMLLFSKELGWMYNESERVLQKDTPSHWLKPIEQVYSLTERELIMVISDCIKYCCGQDIPDVIIKKFLESIKQ